MKLHTLLSILAAGLALTGCEATKQAVGLGKNPPDEFQVVSQAPLSMPPDYNLPAPTPGAPRPQDGSPTVTAENALLANSTAGTSGQPAASQSSGEQALLQTAGATGADPNIRTVVNQEASAETAASEGLLDRLAFWREPEPAGTIVDPTAEQQRLQQNAALGQPITTGATPTIKRRKKALLEGIF
jgi:DUF3035 family protein